MTPIDSEDAARRLVRVIASDIELYNREKLADPAAVRRLLDEGFALFKSRVVPALHGVYATAMAETRLGKAIGAPPPPEPTPARRDPVTLFPRESAPVPEPDRPTPIVPMQVVRTPVPERRPEPEPTPPPAAPAPVPRSTHIESEDAARRLARVILSDIELYNKDRLQQPNAVRMLIAEGRMLFESRVVPALHPLFATVVADSRLGRLLAPPPPPAIEPEPSSSATFEAPVDLAEAGSNDVAPPDAASTDFDDPAATVLTAPPVELLAEMPPPEARTPEPSPRTPPPALRTPPPAVHTPPPALRTPPPATHTPLPALRTPAVEATPPPALRAAPPTQTPPPALRTRVEDETTPPPAPRTTPPTPFTPSMPRTPAPLVRTPPPSLGAPPLAPADAAPIPTRASGAAESGHAMFKLPEPEAPTPVPAGGEVPKLKPPFPVVRVALTATLVAAALAAAWVLGYR